MRAWRREREGSGSVTSQSTPVPTVTACPVAGVKEMMYSRSPLQCRPRMCRTTCSTMYGGSMVTSTGSLALQMEHRREPLVAIHRCRQARCTSLPHVHGLAISTLPASVLSSKQM